jgi:hypothetical protein
MAAIANCTTNCTTNCTRPSHCWILCHDLRLLLTIRRSRLPAESFSIPLGACHQSAHRPSEIIVDAQPIVSAARDVATKTLSFVIRFSNRQGRWGHEKDVQIRFFFFQSRVVHPFRSQYSSLLPIKQTKVPTPKDDVLQVFSYRSCCHCGVGLGHRLWL